MNVLIIPEDFRKDQYMLKPIVTAMFTSLGRPNARIVVCQDPLLQGVSRALDWAQIEAILTRYKGMTDVFLLLIDRDGDENRQARVNAIEDKAATDLGPQSVLFGEMAREEIEVWVLAGHKLDKQWAWKDVRAEMHPKEQYFVPFATQRNVSQGPAGGRKTLGEEAARRYKSIRVKCQEDIGRLESRLKTWLEQHA
jgi:hypothetical protein